MDGQENDNQILKKPLLFDKLANVAKSLDPQLTKFKPISNVEEVSSRLERGEETDMELVDSENKMRASIKLQNQQ